MLPVLTDAARDCGYALAVQGSMQRDFDLIACPWVENASDAEDLIEALRMASNGVINDYAYDYPSKKPCGRWAWSIHLGAGAYIDVSVMPRNGTYEFSAESPQLEFDF